MKKSLLTVVIGLLLSFSLKAQITEKLIGFTRITVIKKMKAKYPNIEHEEEQTKEGEKFTSFYLRPQNVMMDFFFKGKEKKCYKAEYTAERKDLNLVMAYLDRDNIKITDKVWLTPDKTIKMLLTNSNDLTFTIETSKL